MGMLAASPFYLEPQACRGEATQSENNRSRTRSLSPSGRPLSGRPSSRLGHLLQFAAQFPAALILGEASGTGRAIQWKRVDRSRRAPTSSRRSVLVGQQHGRR